MRTVVDWISKRYGEEFSKADLMVMWAAALADFANAELFFAAEAKRLDVGEMTRRIRQEQANATSTHQ